MRTPPRSPTSVRFPLARGDKRPSVLVAVPPVAMAVAITVMTVAAMTATTMIAVAMSAVVTAVVTAMIAAIIVAAIGIDAVVIVSAAVAIHTAAEPDGQRCHNPTVPHGAPPAPA